MPVLQLVTFRGRLTEDTCRSGSGRQAPHLQLGVADHGLGQHVQQGHCRRPVVHAAGEGSFYVGQKEVVDAEGGHAEHCKLAQQICDVVADRGAAAAPPASKEGTIAGSRL